MQTGATSAERDSSSRAVAPCVFQVTKAEQDPLRQWADLLLRLRAVLNDPDLPDDRLGEIAWHVKLRRHAAGEVIALAGERADLWALVVRGLVALQPPGPSPVGRRSLREPAALLQPGSAFGEGMLLRGEPSPCTFRAASDVELFVLHRFDLLAVGRASGAARMEILVRAGRRRWMLVLVTAVVVAVAAWLVSRALGGQINPGRETAETLRDAATARISLLSPREASIVMSQDLIQVRAAMTGITLDQIELLVDGKTAATQGLISRGEEPSEIHLDWIGGQPGSHVLTIRGKNSVGSTAASRPTTIAVVPAGKLVFSSNRSGADAVYSMATDGTGVQLLTAGPGTFRQPAVSTNGGLVFVADVGSGPYLRWIPSGAEQAMDLCPGRDPAWSASGETIAFSLSVDGASQVFIARVADFTSWQLTGETAYAGQPTWAPDGCRLAYVAERGDLDIWLVTTDGGKPTRLTDSAGTDWAPAWSPDGTHLAYVSDRSGQAQVYVSGVESGSIPRQVTTMALGAESPAWSPDGSWLAVVGYSGDGAGVDSREIYLVTADGREAVRLTANGYDDTHPVWVRH